MYGHTFSKSKDQPGQVCQSSSWSAEQGKLMFLCPRSRNVVSRDGFGSPVPRQPGHLHTQAGSGCVLTGFLPSSTAASIYLLKPPYAIGSVPSLSGHAIAYRWRSLPRVRRHRASKKRQCNSSNGVLPWQVTTDQLTCASLSHIHYSI